MTRYATLIYEDESSAWDPTTPLRRFAPARRGVVQSVSHSSDTAGACFAAIVEALLCTPGVTPPSGPVFGSLALRVGDKIFAMLTSRGEFVVKLPRRRVDALVAAGDGERFGPGNGRPMKEWVAVRPTSEAGWLQLAEEAMEFVAPRR